MGTRESRPSASGENVAAPDETTPLNEAPLDAHVEMEETKHKDSVYSFMLFQPELSRINPGHYWTPPVILAFMLLLINLTLQVCLSYIAGQYIQQLHTNFAKTLLHDEDANWAGTIGGRIQMELKEYHGILKEKLHGKEEIGCCNAAECSELAPDYMPCCDRTGADPHQPNRPIVRRVTTTQSGEESSTTAAAAAPAAAPPSINFTTPVPSEIDEADEARKVLSFLAYFKPGGGGGKGGSKAARKDDDQSTGEDTDGLPSMTKSGALCRMKNGTMHCAPSSFAFTEEWNELDRDGNGLWTLEEARADEANLGCKLGMSVEEVFRSVCRGVVRDAKDTYDKMGTMPVVPFSVEQRRAIPKVVFDWWRGLVTICVATDAARCSELVSRGIFDAVMGAKDPSKHRGGVVDLDTAIDYCQRLLVPGGICEKTLPGTYMMHRSRVTEKCGEASYAPGLRYSNPHDSRDVISVVGVSYANVIEYTRCSGLTFTFFLALILFLWYTNLVVELQNILHFGDFIWNFPVDSKGNHPLMTPSMRSLLQKAKIREMGESLSETLPSLRLPIRHITPRTLDENDEEVEVAVQNAADSKNIKSISTLHRWTCGIMLVMRIWLWLWMAETGSAFLLYTKSYDDLLLNAVALAFIFDLPEFLYMFLVNNSIKGNLEEASTIPYPTCLPQKGWKSYLMDKSIWGICVIPFVVFAQVSYNTDRKSVV